MSEPALIIDPKRKAALDAGFSAAFGCLPERYFSAPGRTEIGGNHTDHQRGRGLSGFTAAALPVRYKPLFPLNCWMPLKMAWMRHWEREPVMCCLSVHRAVWR